MPLRPLMLLAASVAWARTSRINSVNTAVAMLLAYRTARPVEQKI